MKYFIAWLWEKFFGRHSERIDGAILFAEEYARPEQFDRLTQLYRPICMRVPFRIDASNSFPKTLDAIFKRGGSTIAHLDCFLSDKAMMSRLDYLRRNQEKVKYIELFNELPQMAYPGDQITSLQMLVDLTNRYSDWIHKNIPGVKVLTMAPYNSIDERNFPAWGVTNTRILKDLILYTTADAAAIHLYGDSLGKQLAAFELACNIDDWNKEAKFKKNVWITEVGVDDWEAHVDYYHKLIRLFVNVLAPKQVIWYRQTIAKELDADASFALECRETAVFSPLYFELGGK